jgi:Ran GTPase-activating protein (RanGAP) involved in mRNA processing and transport
MATSAAPASPRLPFGLTQEQVRTELYTAWRKDTREPASTEAYKRYRAFIDNGLRDKEVVLRHAAIGVNFALCLASLLARNTQVAKLDLYGNMLRDAGAEALAHFMRESPSLVHLNLGANDIGASGIAALANAIAGHKKLQVLVLGSSGTETHLNRVDPASAKTLLEACLRCKSIKWLDLSRNPIGRGSQESFVTLVQFIAASPNLQVLKVGETEMTTESALMLVEAVRKSTTLSEIHLHSNRLHSRVGDVLGMLLDERGRRSTPSALKTLSLHTNPTFGPGGATPIFRGLGTDKSLTTLVLHGCNVDDDSVMVLCNSLDCNSALTVARPARQRDHQCRYHGAGAVHRVAPSAADA